MVYKTKGVCSRSIDIELDGRYNKISKIQRRLQRQYKGNRQPGTGNEDR